MLNQWETDIQRCKEAEDKLQEMFKQQQKMFQQQRVVQVKHHTTSVHSRLYSNESEGGCRFFFAFLRLRHISKLIVLYLSLLGIKLIHTHTHTHTIIIAVQAQRLKTIKQLHEQYKKGMEELEKCHRKQQADMQTEIKKEMALLQKKMLMESVSREGERKREGERF